MTLKFCRGCNTAKPFTEFYMDNRRGKPYPRCKKCNYKKIIAVPLEKCRARRNRYRANHLEQERAREREQHKRTPQFKKVARRAVAEAIKSGTLIRPETCDQCGNKGRIHGHHPDYFKPLSVQWLCPLCHADAHRKLKDVQHGP